MQVYTQINIDLMLSEIDNYFQTYNNQERFFWVLTHKPMPNEIQDISGGKTFGNEKSKITILDLFDGRKPGKLFHNYKTATYDVGFRPTLILDSQLVAYLRLFVENQHGSVSNRLNPELERNVESFLRFVISKGYDYNPIFYYIESLIKDASGNFEESAVRDAKAILKLHSMDEKHFLETGKIEVDENLLQYYKDEYGTNTFEETAKQRSLKMSDSLYTTYFHHIEKFIYVALLKATIIEKELSGNNKENMLLEKLSELREFMERDLRIVLIVEYYICIYYFSNLTEKFIPRIQNKLNTRKAFIKLRSAAWDILLLRFPAMLLMMNLDEISNLGFIATADTSFTKIAKQFVLGGITPLPYNSEGHSDNYLFRHNELTELHGIDVLNAIQTYNENKSRNRTASKLYNQVTGRPEKKLSLTELNELIIRIEEKFIKLCQT